MLRASETGTPYKRTAPHVPRPAPAPSQVWELCKPELVVPDSTPAERECSRRAFCAGASAVLSILLATAARGDQTRDVRRALNELLRTLHDCDQPETAILDDHSRNARRAVGFDDLAWARTLTGESTVSEGKRREAP
jgi:hypothetical protein